MNRITRTAAGALAALMVALAMPNAAIAQTESTALPAEQSRDHGAGHLEPVRERVLSAIDHRLERIDRLQSRIRGSETVEPRNAAHLTADLSASQGGLTALAARARNVGTVEELRAIFEDVVYEHRIYALRTPQTGLVLASDFGVAIAGRLDSAAATLAVAAARAAEAGHDVTAVEALIDEAEALTADGLAAVDPVAGTVLPLEPSDVPDPSRAVLQQAHADMVDGREAFRSARDISREAARLLADIVGADAS